MTGSSRSKPVVEWAERMGCKVSRAGNGHFKVTFRGRLVGTICATPSDKRSPLNDMSLIRRNIKKIKKENPWRARPSSTSSARW